MVRGSRRTVGVLVIAAAIAGQPPLNVGAQAPTTLTVAQSVAVTALDPAGPVTSGGQPTGDAAAFLIYDGLVRFAADMSIVPDLATSWSVGSDGRTWTFKIRRGVSFQDGTPLVAQAVVANLQRELNASVNQSNRPLWDPIASVSAPDTATVQVVTKEPYGALLNTLAHRSGLIASPQAVEASGARYGLHPVGAGPYQVERWQVGTQLDVVRNPQYWGGRPALDRIVLRHIPDPSARFAMVRNGQAQVGEAIAPESVAELRHAPGVTVIVEPGLRTFGMGINMNRTALQDIRVRRALNYAVNKELIVNALFGGNATVLRSPLSPRASGYAQVGPWPYDPPKARTLLEAAGWKPAPPIGVRVKDGQSLEITLLTPQGSFPRDVEVVETLADYLRNVGFGVHFLYAGPEAFSDYLLAPPDQSKWDLAFFGFDPSNGDGGHHLDPLYRSNPDRQHRPRAWNVTWYASPQVDAWLADAGRSLDPRVRADAYARVQRQVWNDVPYLWLYAEDVITATRDASGVEVLPTGVTLLRAARR